MATATISPPNSVTPSGREPDAPITPNPDEPTGTPTGQPEGDGQPKGEPDAKPDTTPVGSPKTKSAETSLYEDLESLAAPAKPDDKTGKPDKAAGKPGTPPASKTTDEPPDDGKGGKKGKVNPWAENRQLKEQLHTLQTELEKKSTALTEQEKQQFTNQVEQLTTQLKEAQNELRFANYAKSQEFKEKFIQPYEQAWQQALADFNGLNIPDKKAPGGERPMTQHDLMEIVNEPSLGRAREIAEDKFGSFADDVMSHRKEIRRLFQAQKDALDKARTEGEQRELQQTKTAQTFNENLEKTVRKTWDEANAASKADERFGQYFRPDEQDKEFSDRLERGYKFTHEALATDVKNPNLTPEQRDEAVRRLVAVFNRSAAFSAMVHREQKWKTLYEETKQKLDEIMESAPGFSGAPKGKKVDAQAGGLQGVLNEMDKLANR